MTGTEPAWEDFVVSFTLPEDCPAQTIKLALHRNERSRSCPLKKFLEPVLDLMGDGDPTIKARAGKLKRP